MKQHPQAGLLPFAMALPMALPAVSFASEAAHAAVTVKRERTNLDRVWRFPYGHTDDAEKHFFEGLRPYFFAKVGYGDEPTNAEFFDTAWRHVDLPHDWTIELPFDDRRQRQSQLQGAGYLGYTPPKLTTPANGQKYLYAHVKDLTKHVKPASGGKPSDRMTADEQSSYQTVSIQCDSLESPFQ